MPTASIVLLHTFIESIMKALTCLSVFVCVVVCVCVCVCVCLCVFVCHSGDYNDETLDKGDVVFLH